LSRVSPVQYSPRRQSSWVLADYGGKDLWKRWVFSLGMKQWMCDGGWEWWAGGRWIVVVSSGLVRQWTRPLGGGVVWCGVVRCGVVWYSVVWCDVVWCGAVRCGVVWCGASQCVGAGHVDRVQRVEHSSFAERALGVSRHPLAGRPAVRQHRHFRLQRVERRQLRIDRPHRRVRRRQEQDTGAPVKGRCRRNQRNPCFTLYGGVASRFVFDSL